MVAILLDNGLPFLQTAFAVNGVGAIFLPLNVRLAVDEWGYILEHSGASAIVVAERFVEHLPALRTAAPCLRLSMVAADSSVGADATLDDLMKNTGSRNGFAPVALDDVSRLMYPSGTTSRPKGVPLTYGNFLWKTFGHVLELGLSSADRTIVAGPMYHVGAFDLPGVGVLYVGGSLVILPRFDAATVLATIERTSATNLWLAPSMLNAILALDAGPNASDTSSVRFVTNGGEKMPGALIERFHEVFPSAWLADSFGLTETVSGDTFLDPQSTLAKLGSVGRPIPYVEMKVVDELGVDAPPNTPGELLLRGPKVFSGYWKDPDATARAFVGGWFRTGDIAHMDDDGYLFIDDRKKDMIISGGENIASPEVERVLYQHPAVLEAAVVGVPDTRWGEVPKAVVVLRQGAVADEGELISFCQQRLARFKVPKYVQFVAQLPRTASGKVLKRDLR